jgi:hypothetical protein
MAAVLSTAGTVSCPHQGTVKPFKSGAKLTVSRRAVALATQVSGWRVPGCTNTTSPNVPCQKAAGAPTSGVATKLTCGAESVLLDSLSAATLSVPPGLLSAKAGQSKLTAS